jgi:hypothetical protein
LRKWILTAAIVALPSCSLAQIQSRVDSRVTAAYSTDTMNASAAPKYSTTCVTPPVDAGAALGCRTASYEFGIVNLTPRRNARRTVLAVPPMPPSPTQKAARERLVCGLGGDGRFGPPHSDSGTRGPSVNPASL